jgi:murein DD-endopeptidase MepM/ murein hydrolase activator NlpD
MSGLDKILCMVKNNRKKINYYKITRLHSFTKHCGLVKCLLLLILISAFVGIFYFENKKAFGTDEAGDNEIEVRAVIDPDKKKIIGIGDGDTYGVLMEDAGIGGSVANGIYDAAADEYDLVKIRAGRALELTYEKDSENLKELVYKIDSEEEMIVKDELYYNKTATTSKWIAEIIPIDYEVKIVVRDGEVKTSMYEAALDNNIDERAIIELANAFQWTIDFAMDPRAGDTFKFVYEERYLEGEYAMPGRILAGYYVNDGKRYNVYYFEEDEENIGYFDEEGNSVQKMFLKAPLAFKYISSGFTAGARYIKAFNISTGHKAIDYAAAYGTPVRSVGDGTVISAAYNGSYGYMVTVHHNGTYTTNYGHLSKFAVKYGAKVKQGDIIGYVGSTGLSTGPHLHYEMVKNGAKVNPLREVLPPGKPIKEENRDRFFSEIKKWQEMLGE